MVHKEILQARDALLEKVNNHDVKKILEELHVILASDDGHKKVFPDIPMIGFKVNKNLTWIP